jgi:hypothetical protein
MLSVLEVTQRVPPTCTINTGFTFVVQFFLPHPFLVLVRLQQVVCPCRNIFRVRLKKYPISLCFTWNKGIDQKDGRYGTWCTYLTNIYFWNKYETSETMPNQSGCTFNRQQHRKYPHLFQCPQVTRELVLVLGPCLVVFLFGGVLSEKVKEYEKSEIYSISLNPF